MRNTEKGKDDYIFHVVTVVVVFVVVVLVVVIIIVVVAVVVFSFSHKVQKSFFGFSKRPSILMIQ